MRKDKANTHFEKNYSEFITSRPLNVAVLFVVFNRVETTRRVFEAIRQAKPPRLYVAADGPRKNREGEAERVAQVRAIATAVDWPCELSILFQTENIGCQFGPKAGIDWFFENEEYGIILEDDCLPSQSFFWFCEEMLVKFRNDESVMAVTGINIFEEGNFNGDYFYSNFALMWGWASWRRAWELYDIKISEWPQLKKQRWLKTIGIGGMPFEKKWEMIFDLTTKLGDSATWWDYQWIYCCWKNKGLTIAPRLNLIRNIGHTAEATHTVEDHPIFSNLVPKELCWPLLPPKNIEPNKQVDNFINRHWFNAGWRYYFSSKLRLIPGFKCMNEFRKRVIKKIERKK